MTRSTEATAARRASACVALLLAGLGGNAAFAQAPGRLVDLIEATPKERNVDVLVQFNCSVRYLTHSPLDLGSSAAIRLRLGPDCGAAPRNEQAPILGDGGLLKRARVEESAPGEAMLTIEWSRELHFVLAPTTSGRGLRLRLLDVRAGKARVSLEESDTPVSGYAINLDSSTQPFAPEVVAAAGEMLRMPAYVSTLELEGQIWYRLRAGPILAQKDADRLLAAAQQKYPRAWLGINDEVAAVTTGTPAISDIAPTVPIDPALPDAERRKLMDAARTAMSRKDHPRAIELLTKLTRQPEYPDRARAQELLGLTRERAGQLAHAKAEYSEYLRRYPQGDASTRIRTRLRLLASAGRGGKRGTLFGGGEGEEGWKLAGGASQMYRWERSTLTTPEASNEQQNQNAIYTDADLTARRRGERFDFTSRVSAGYAKDMLDVGPGDQTRVSAAFVELNDRTLGVAARLGRQSRNNGGLLGTFDGLFASYQLKPRIALNAAVGFPVESTRESPQTDRRFLGVAAEFGPFNDKWDFGAFAVAQTLAGETDRRGLGVEARYFVPGKTFIGLLDYDAYYQTINSAVLMGNLQLPARWTASFNFDHRRAPVLTTRNALIGQPVQTLDELLSLFTSEQIRQLAEDRTAQSDIYSLSIARPLGDRFQFSVDAFASRAAATISSGGVAATPATGFDKTLQVQFSGSSLWRSSDLWVIAARYQDSDVATTQSLSLASRLPIGGAWRIGPRLRVDRRESTIDAAEEMLYVPTLRLDYQRGGTWIEFEGGAELGDRTLPADNETSRRYYFGLGYRISF